MTGPLRRSIQMNCGRDSRNSLTPSAPFSATRTRNPGIRQPLQYHPVFLLILDNQNAVFRLSQPVDVVQFRAPFTLRRCTFHLDFRPEERNLAWPRMWTVPLISSIIWRVRNRQAQPGTFMMLCRAGLDKRIEASSP